MDKLVIYVNALQLRLTKRRKFKFINTVFIRLPCLPERIALN